MRRAVIIAVAALSLAPAVAAADEYVTAVLSTPGLVHYWRFEEPVGEPVRDAVTGATTQLGERSSAPGATDDGGTAWRGATPLWPGLPRLTATDAGPLTLELWIDREGSSTLFHGPQAYVNTYGNGDLHITWWRPRAQSIELEGALGAGRWHHVAITVDAATLRVYVNGVLAGEGAVFPPPYAENLQSESTFESGTSNVIDELAVYDRALGADTIRAHARAGYDGIPPRPVPASPLPPVSNRAPGPGSFTAQRAGTVLTCVLDGVDRSCDSLAVYDEGPHMLEVHAIDRFGVRATAPYVHRWVVDRSPPDSLSVSRVEDRPGGNAIIAFASTEAGSTFVCQRGQLIAPCTSPLVVGRHSGAVSIYAVDPAGNNDPFPTRIATDGRYSGVHQTLGLDVASYHISGGRAAQGNTAAYSCSLDGEPWRSCGYSLKLPVLGAGVHSLVVCDSLGLQTPPLTWTVGALPGPPRLLTATFPVLVERSRKTLRRTPKLRFMLTAATPVSLTLLRGRATVAHAAVMGATGANVLRLPSRLVKRLALGRHRLRVSVGSSRQTLSFAVVRQRL